ncbi:TniQ family protein [Streptomyces goshikiensis]
MGTGRPPVADTTVGAGLRPFGLSLDPLEGESLAGFVLRLAHRLHISPHELARQTGLTEQDRLRRARASLSTRLTPAETKNFAATTRLDPREVRAMTLEPLASRYPPAARSVANARAGKVYSTHADGWLFPTTARYCPRCLAGDGSDTAPAAKPVTSNRPSTPSPPSYSRARSSTTNTDARSSPLGRWNPRTGSTYSRGSRTSPATGNPSATTAGAWPSAPTSGPASPKASPTSPPARRTSPPTPHYAPSGPESDTTSSTGSAPPTTSPTTAPSSHYSKPTPSNWPRRSTTTHNAAGDNQPAYVTTTVLRLNNRHGSGTHYCGTTNGTRCGRCL